MAAPQSGAKGQSASQKREDYFSLQKLQKVSLTFSNILKHRH